jgi:4-hydroxyphenylpyruvate dioxygenase-like putative hemolysin
VADIVDLEARISAIEMIVVTHILQSGLSTDGFDPTAFAVSRRDAWAAVGKAVCAGCSSETEEHEFAEAYARALERIGHLLVVLADPVQEAVDEVLNEASAMHGGNTLQDASREAVEDLKRKEAAGAPTAGAGDIG